jgi:molybdenum cofactor biosynthesis enzyme
MRVCRREILKTAVGAAVIAAASYPIQFLRTAHAQIVPGGSLLQAAKAAGIASPSINVKQLARDVGMVPPISVKGLIVQLRLAQTASCAVCNDGSCQCGPRTKTGDQLCAGHKGVDPTLGCNQTP